MWLLIGSVFGLAIVFQLAGLIISVSYANWVSNLEDGIDLTLPNDIDKEER